MIKKDEINGVKFYYRTGSSDYKCFDEVVKRNAYQSKKMQITKGEHWIDCGGNVGAFTLLACSKGAYVTVYEPDPYSCEMIEKNLKLNNFNANVHCKGLVHNDTKRTNLYIGNNGNVWRNSMLKNWNGKKIQVDCVNFDEVVGHHNCVKMDVEGAEMPILENTNRIFKKLIFEWSFDIDPNLIRFWNVIDRLKKKHEILNLANKAKYETREYNVWQKSWFPPCVNIFCNEKN